MKTLTRNQIAMYNARAYDGAKSVETIKEGAFTVFAFSKYETLLKCNIFEKIHFSTNRNHKKNTLKNSEFENMQGFCVGKFGRDFFI